MPYSIIHLINFFHPFESATNILSIKRLLLIWDYAETKYTDLLLLHQSVWSKYNWNKSSWKIKKLTGAHLTKMILNISIHTHYSAKVEVPLMVILLKLLLILINIYLKPILDKLLYIEHFRWDTMVLGKYWTHF